MSLMNILNNTGPRTVPWGTPNTTGVQSENIWKNMDQTMPTIIHVLREANYWVNVVRYQQEFCKKFTPTEQM